jgi:hypothetical protein
VVQSFLQVFSPARVATWRAFEVPSGHGCPPGANESAASAMLVAASHNPSFLPFDLWFVATPDNWTSIQQRSGGDAIPELQDDQ